MTTTRSAGPHVIVTCEHASNAIPSSLKKLGLDDRLLESHLAHDLGARDVARFYARALGAELHEGHWSRLVVDLNRSPRHRAVIAERSFGVEIPGNVGVDANEKRRRLERYHEPFRKAVVRSLARASERGRPCVHLSVHSFTPVVGRQPRRVDVGILYDPSRPNERSLAKRWVRALDPSGLHHRVRRLGRTDEPAGLDHSERAARHP